MTDTSASSFFHRPARKLSVFGGMAVLLAGLAAVSTLRAQDIGDYGDVSALNGIGAGITPADPTSQSLLTTENSSATHDGGTVFTDATNADGSTGAVPLTTMAAFIGADPTTVNYNANNPGTEGSAFGMFVATTGPTLLSLDYDFVTSELVGDANVHPDFAFATVAQVDNFGDLIAVTQFQLLASAADPAGDFTAIVDPLGTSPFNLQEGYQTLAIEEDTPGNYIISVGVADADTFDTQSGLFVDAVSVTAVPEPGSLALLVLAAAACAVAYNARRGTRAA